MPATSIQPTFPIFTDTNGLPLENGYIWIGAANLDPQGNPIAVYWDAALTIAAAQPIRTLAGYPSRSGTPARIFIAADYSVRVQDSKGGTVYTALSVTDLSGSSGASLIGFGTQTVAQALANQSYIGADVITAGTTDTTTINAHRGSPANSIAAGDANTISGGGNTASPNIISGNQDYRTIGGGYDNRIEACVTSTIVGGSHNWIKSPADHATVGGSFNVVVNGADGTISGGAGSTISGGNGVTISGGSSHTVDAASNNATIGGGSTNTVKNRWGTVGGGILNTASGDQAVVSGGNGNYARDGAFIGGGYQNLAGSASYASDSSVIAGGYQNKTAQTAAANYASIGGGFQNAIDANYATILGGIGNVVSGAFGTAWGQRSKAYNYGQTAWSSGMFASAGDCQASSMVARRVTTNATPTDLLLDGGGPVITVPLNTAWTFKCMVICARTDGTPGSDYASYDFSGMVICGATVGSITTQGVTKTVIYESDASFDCSVSAFSGFLRVVATGATGKTLRWVARLDLVEVRFV